jgi:hypothetical protein
VTASPLCKFSSQPRSKESYMARNDPSLPMLGNFNCPTHGARMLAPVTSTIYCRCGLPCNLDVEAWVADMQQLHPDHSLRELAGMAGIPFEKVEEALQGAISE